MRVVCLPAMKPEQVLSAHDGPIATLHRSPFFKDIILTVGGWTFAIWKEGVTVSDLRYNLTWTRSSGLIFERPFDLGKRGLGRTPLSLRFFFLFPVSPYIALPHTPPPPPQKLSRLKKKTKLCRRANIRVNPVFWKISNPPIS